MDWNKLALDSINYPLLMDGCVQAASFGLHRISYSFSLIEMF